MFIDETSAYVGQSREYSWGSSKERVYDTRPKGKKERVSLIAATTPNGIMAEQALVIPGTVNKNAFLAFLETTLLPTLAKDSVLVMGPNEVRTQRNNWSVHHGDDVRKLVEDYGCELLYLPTYSPDLVLGKTAPSGPARNPIEHLFAKLKSFIRALRPETTAALVQAFCQAVKTLTPQNIFNSFQHCGYDVGQ